jgi:hypothetical protein
MSTVSNVPVPPKNVTPKSNITSDSAGGSAGYARPTAGGNVTGDAAVAPGVIPDGATAYSAPAGAPVSTGDTQAGPDIGSGATIVSQSDAGDVSPRTDFPKDEVLP